MDYLNAFLCGGILCAIGQILIDKTPLTPARILTGYVVCGVLLTAIGVYEPIVKWGGAGATVPLLGFGYSLAKGVEKAVQEQGWLFDLLKRHHSGVADRLPLDLRKERHNADRHVSEHEEREREGVEHLFPRRAADILPLRHGRDRAEHKER